MISWTQKLIMRKLSLTLGFAVSIRNTLFELPLSTEDSINNIKRMNSLYLLKDCVFLFIIT